jgi:hypothetical protein
VNRLLRHYADNLVVSNQGRRLLGEYQAFSRDWIAGAKQVVSLTDEGRHEEAVALLNGRVAELGVRLSKVSNEWIQNNYELATAAGNEAVQAIMDARGRMLVGNTTAVLLTGLLQDGEVATVHHVYSKRARAGYEMAEVRIQLRRATGDVDDRQVRNSQEREHLVGDLPRHHLCACRTRVHVAVHAALVALVSEVDLEGVEAPAADGRERGLAEQRERGTHRLSQDAFLTFDQLSRSAVPTPELRALLQVRAA